MGGRVLIVDDSALLRREIQRVLAADGTFEHFSEAADGLVALRMAVEQRPDVIVCDLVMPGVDGLKFLSLYAQRPAHERCPVIMLTSEGDAARKAEILEMGASDYVTKPFHGRELQMRVRVHYRLKALADELRAANAGLEALATIDPLSGLFNRRHLERVLDDELRRAQRYRLPLTVVLADVDFFKRVNDTYGHAMGDVVIKNLGRVFNATVRTTDVVARYGGEEIVVVLPHTSLADGVQVAERLRQTFAATTHTLDDVSIRKTASFGVASFEDAASLSSATLLARADEALYRAKHAGRDRVVAWSRGAPPASVMPHGG